MYNDKVMELFQNPKNVGKLKGATCKASVQDFKTSDVIELSIKIDEDGEVENAKFRAFGGARIIAICVITTEMMKGKTIEEVLKITSDDIYDELNVKPVDRRNGGNLAIEAILAVMEKYWKKLEKLSKKDAKDKLLEKQSNMKI